MSAKKNTEFPTFVYVKEEDAGDGEKFFITDTAVEALAEIDTSVRVATYRLECVQTLTLEPKITE